MMSSARRNLWVVVLLMGALPLISVAAAQAAGPVAELSAGPAAVEWQPLASYERMVLTVSGPGGLSIRREFEGTRTPTLSLFDEKGQRLPEGRYNWELRAVPSLDREVQQRLASARRTGDEEAVRQMRAEGKLPEGPVQSGSFAITNGSFVTPGQTEEPRARQPRNRAAAGSTGGIRNTTAADQVIPDDLIVQQSLCVGFDCVNNESFGFDTIRLKENNTRIKFEDTSVGTFPSNDWQLTANDSASGGANKFSIEDISGSRVPFTITAGASTNSIFVDSTGRVGFRTSTPVLDLHVNTSNTPALRLEQNNTGGFTAQTWDVAGNEANFFVRDATNGSTLPFRIRPGAPSSSIDISADGDVGLGTGSPEAALHVFGGNTADTFICVGPNCDGSTSPPESALNFGYGGASNGRASAFFNVRPDSGATAPNPSLRFLTGNNERMIIDNEGFIGLGGVANPTSPIQHSTGAVLSSTGQWVSASTRKIKQDIHELSAAQALDTLHALSPVTFSFKSAPDDTSVGFIAEDVPELVAEKSRANLNPIEIVAVLAKVVKEQEKMINELSSKVAELEKQQK